MIGRRGIILGLLMAPAVVRAESLMRIVPTCDAAFLQRKLDAGQEIDGGTWHISRGLIVRREAVIQNCSIVTTPDFMDKYIIKIDRNAGLSVENLRFGPSHISTW